MKKVFELKTYQPNLILVILCLSLMSSEVWGQFESIIGFRHPVEERSPGGVMMPSGFMVLGSNQLHPYANNPGSGDLELVRLDNTGNFIYSKVLDRSNRESASWIEKIGFCYTPDDCMIAGNNEDSMFIAQIDDVSQQTWVYSYGQAGAILTSSCVKMDINSEIIALGTLATTSNQLAVVAIQMDCSGVPNWKKVFLVNGYSLSSTSITTFDTHPGGPGAYYITGKATPILGGDDQVFIMQISTNGNFGYLKFYDLVINADDVGNCIQGNFAFNSQGELWVAGTSQNNSGAKSIIMLKTDINGIPIWGKNLDITGGDELATHFSFTPNNKIVLTGKAVIFNNPNSPEIGSAMLMRMDEGVTTIDWNHVFALGGYSDQGNRVEVTPSDEYFISGQSLEVLSSSQFSNNILVIKTDNQGELADDTCFFPISVQINPLMPMMTTIGPPSLTLSDLADPDGIGYDTIPYGDSSLQCSVIQSDCDFTWVAKNCFEIEFTAFSTNPQGGIFTYDLDIGCDGSYEFSNNVASSSYTFSYTFPCGGGTYPVCITIQDPNGSICTVMHNVTVPNTCCGHVTYSNVSCSDSADYYHFNMVISDPPYVGITACVPILTNNTPGSTIVNWNYTSNIGSTTVYGIIQVPSLTPLALNFIVQMNCVCPSGAPVTCTIQHSIPTICCKEIFVDDAVICEDGIAYGHVVTVSKWPPLNNISQVTWYVMPKPLTGCPPAAWNIAPYQQELTNALNTLILYPQNLSGDVCVYAVVHLNDGPCRTITSNVATISFCSRNDCTLNDLNICYKGTPVIPGLITATITASSNGCLSPTIDWYDQQNNHVQAGGTTYQPTSALSMFNPANNCYEDFFYTMVITDLCGQRSCQSRVRLYSDQVDYGRLEMDPTEQQPLCRGEDVTLKFIPTCAGDPPMWHWYTRDCFPGGAVTPVPNSGTMNPKINTNKLFQSIYYRVEATNGACPSKNEELLIEVREPMVLQNFTAVADPCAEQSVLLTVDVSPCNVSCLNTPCNCTYTVNWYKDGLLLSTTNGGPSQSYVYSSLPLAGNYYAVVKEDCCPNNVLTTFSFPINRSCEPTIMAPCFICDNVPVVLMAQMVLPPTTPCPNFCVYNWYIWTSTWTWIGSGDMITVNGPGLYLLESDCGGCIKFAQYYLPQCLSFTGGNQCAVSCCIDEETFYYQIENEVNLVADSCSANVSIGNLPACDYIQNINWGDGSESVGPFYASEDIEHNYAESGAYIITYLGIESDPDTGDPCFTRTFSDTINPVCQNFCPCIPWPNLTLKPGGGGSNISISCGNDIFISCIPGTTSILTGTYQCSGCIPSTLINWQLYHPISGVIASGSTLATPGFSIQLPSVFFFQPGTYTFTITAMCSGYPCPCIFYFVVPSPCPSSCPCNLNQFAIDVGKGNLHIINLNNPCRRCFVPRGLTPCDKVEWSISPNPSTILATTYGNQSFCYTFPPGTYTIYRKVTRRFGVNSICAIYTSQTTLSFSCTPTGPSCPKPKLFNGGFDKMATSGVLGLEGNSEDWINIAGSPYVDTSSNSVDGWIMNLSGNSELQDAISLMEPICMAKDSGTMRILMRSANINGLPVHPKKGETLVVQFVRGDELLPLNCASTDCIDVAEVAITGELAGWNIVEFSYDLRNVVSEDTCFGEPSLLIRPVFYLKNDLESSANPDSTSHLQLDWVCIEDPTPVSTISPEYDYISRVYPNPTTGSISIEFTQPANAGMSIRIISIEGKILMQQKVQPMNSIQTIEAIHLAQGMYFIQVISGNQILASDKFVKM